MSGDASYPFKNDYNQCFICHEPQLSANQSKKCLDGCNVGSKRSQRLSVLAAVFKYLRISNDVLQSYVQICPEVNLPFCKPCLKKVIGVVGDVDKLFDVEKELRDKIEKIRQEVASSYSQIATEKIYKDSFDDNAEIKRLDNLRAIRKVFRKTLVIEEKTIQTLNKKIRKFNKNETSNKSSSCKSMSLLEFTLSQVQLQPVVKLEKIDFENNSSPLLKKSQVTYNKTPEKTINTKKEIKKLSTPPLYTTSSSHDFFKLPKIVSVSHSPAKKPKTSTPHFQNAFSDVDVDMLSDSNFEFENNNDDTDLPDFVYESHSEIAENNHSDDDEKDEVVPKKKARSSKETDSDSETSTPLRRSSRPHKKKFRRYPLTPTIKIENKNSQSASLKKVKTKTPRIIKESSSSSESESDSSNSKAMANDLKSKEILMIPDLYEFKSSNSLGKDEEKFTLIDKISGKLFYEGIELITDECSNDGKYNSVQCGLCEFKTTSEYAIESSKNIFRIVQIHIKTKHLNSYQCLICHKNLKNHTGLTSHLKLAHSSKNQSIHRMYIIPRGFKSTSRGNLYEEFLEIIVDEESGKMSYDGVPIIAENKDELGYLSAACGYEGCTFVVDRLRTQSRSMNMFRILQIHIKGTHLRAYKCDRCDRVFMSNIILKDHMVDFHSRGSDKNKWSMTKKHRGGLPHSAVISNFSIQNLCQLPLENSKSIYREPFKKSFTKDAEGKMFIEKIEIIPGEVDELGYEYVSCSVCNYSAERNLAVTSSKNIFYSLYIHIMGVHYDCYKCGLCFKKYSSVSSLRTHYKNFHHVNKKNAQILSLSKDPKIIGQKYEPIKRKLVELKKNKAKPKGLPKEIKKTRDGKIMYGDYEIKILNENTEDPQIQCVLCERCFKIKENMSIKSAIKVVTNHIDVTHLESHLCHICNKRLGSRSALAYHIEIFHPLDPVPAECEVCGMPALRRFEDQHQYKTHLITHMNEEEKEAEKDRIEEEALRVSKLKGDDGVNLVKRVSTFDDIGIPATLVELEEGIFKFDDEHKIECITTTEGKLQIKCLTCQQLYNIDKYGRVGARNPFRCVMNHIRAMHLDMYKCHECNRNFKNKYTLYEHNSYVHEAFPTSCEVCGKPFPKGKKYLKSHIWTHKSQEEKDEAIAKGEKEPSDMHLVQTRNRMKFIERLKDKPPRQCPYCLKKIALKNVYDDHILTHLHPDERPKFLCFLCGKSYPAKRKLTDHINKKHHPENLHMKFYCKYCQKGFPTEATFKKHERLHTGERPFTCNLCGSGYMTRSNLTRHEQNCTQKSNRKPKKSKRRSIENCYESAEIEEQKSNSGGEEEGSFEEIIINNGVTKTESNAEKNIAYSSCTENEAVEVETVSFFVSEDPSSSAQSVYYF